MLLGGALEETRGTSTPGVRDHLRDEARRKALRSHVTRCPKKLARSDGLYLAVQRLLLPTAALAGSGAARENSSAIRVGLEPSSDVPRDETRVSEDGGIRVTARQRPQKATAGPASSALKRRR